MVREKVAGIVMLLAAAVAPAVAGAQNILMPTDSIERLLRHEVFEIMTHQGSRFEGDRTSRVALTFADGTMLPAKWAPAPTGGEAFNNNPRFELAAYELQKLFLDEEEYVVPPTVVRAFPLAWLHEMAPAAEPTFFGTESVLVVLQYWLFNVTADDVWDRGRFDSDPAYAHHFGNFNVVTHLVRHADENTGNYLISTARSAPRVFSVDNGIAFSSDRSDRGDRWRHIRVSRLPAPTVERLRGITEEDLIRRLETVAEFRIRQDGQLEQVDPGPALNGGQGIRREGDTIQLGLTRREIRDVWRRLERLVADVNRGKIEMFEIPGEGAA